MFGSDRWQRVLCPLLSREHHRLESAIAHATPRDIVVVDFVFAVERVMQSGSNLVVWLVGLMDGWMDGWMDHGQRTMTNAS